MVYGLSTVNVDVGSDFHLGHEIKSKLMVNAAAWFRCSSLGLRNRRLVGTHHRFTLVGGELTSHHIGAKIVHMGSRGSPRSRPMVVPAHLPNKIVRCEKYMSFFFE